MKEIKILELFGGIGAIRKAFERLNIPHKVVDYVEIDKYAVKSYNAMFNENFECQDITNWDKDIDIDFIMYGSPCQDFSVAGKGAGGDLGSGTRSSLMYETIRIVGKLRPKYVVWENVKNLLSKKHKHNFDVYIETMNILGYNSYYQVLNAKDYGIPQNRERVYTISIRKDIDAGTFKFPEKEELKLRLKNMLENEVEEKYYLSDRMIQGFIKHNENHKQKGTGFIWKPKNENGISPTLNTNNEIKVIGNYMPSGHNASRIVDNEGLAPTVKENHGTVTATNYGLRIRKLTPKECWRLMGFDDEDFEKAKAVPTSNTQLYKQAGNSIVVNVLEKILLNLFREI